MLETVDDVTNWKRLGLVLGLRYPTLTRIQKYQHGNLQDCKLEMLSAWLQQEDDVSLRGLPSWQVLQTALRGMGDYSAAEFIEQIYMVSYEYIIW